MPEGSIFFGLLWKYCYISNSEKYVETLERTNSELMPALI